MASLTSFGGSDALKVLSSYRIVLEILRSIVGIARGRAELKEARVKERERKAFVTGFWWGAGITMIFLIFLFAAAASSRSI